MQQNKFELVIVILLFKMKKKGQKINQMLYSLN